MLSKLIVVLLAFLPASVLAVPDEKDPDAVPSWILSVDPPKMTDEQRTDILWEEKKQRKRVQNLVSQVDAGAKTQLSKIPALHDLGRVLYKLDKFDDALEISREVAEIYAREYGRADRRTISAFINVASTLNRLGSTEECHTIMKGMFPAQLDRFGIGSKEVAFHIGKMRVFGLPEEEISRMVSEYKIKQSKFGAARTSVSGDGSILKENN